MSLDRLSQLRISLANTQSRLAEAAIRTDRDPAEVTLIVVTKTYPASDVALLHQLGVGEVGENRVQEAVAKQSEVDEILGLSRQDSPVAWHHIGQVQTNKAKQVAEYASMVHSVDRPSLVSALSKAASALGRELPCLVQLSLDGDDQRAGVPIGQHLQLAQLIHQAPGLRLAGLMAVAPLHQPADKAFSPLLQFSEELQTIDSRAKIISAGMSGDAEEAIRAGATHLRLGSAILGYRL